MPNVSETYTYLPDEKVLYTGYLEDYRDVGYSNQFIASLERIGKKDFNAARTVDGRIEELPIEYQVTDVSELVAATKKAQTEYNAAKKAMRHPGGIRSRQFAANYNRMMVEKTAELNDSAIQQVTILQFVQGILGQIETESQVAKIFINLSLGQLRGKIPEGGTPGITIQASRLSEATINHTDFGQTEFRIRRNDIHLYIPREDRMEATVDPMVFSTAQGQLVMKQARDLMALQEASNLILQPDNVISDPTTTTGTVMPRATNNPIGEFMAMIQNHFTEHKNRLKYFVMNALDYQAIQSNFYIRNNIQSAPAEGWGIVPFIGLESFGIQAVISPWCPRRTGYALCSQGAYELDGPKIVDTEYDVKHFADYSPIRDFIGYKIVNPARYGEKFEIEIAGVAKEKEILTDDDIQTRLKSPKVDKNPDA